MASRPNTQRFMAVYKSPEMTTEEFTAQWRGVEFGLTRSGLRLQVPGDLPVGVVGKEYSASPTKELALAEGDALFWILVSTRTGEWGEGEREGALAVDRVVTHLSMLYGRKLFHTVAFRGTVAQPVRGSTRMPMRITVLRPVDLPADEIGSRLTELADRLDEGDASDRYSLMAHFYQRAMQERVLEMRFLFLWFALEIFPLDGTSNLSRVNDFIATTVLGGVDQLTMAQRLQVGRLYGLRADLVHNGRWLEGHDSLASATTKLADIVWEILRAMAGLQYSGALEPHLK